MSTTQTKVPAGTWNLDPVHSAVGFEVDYLAGTFRGQFRDVQVELDTADSGARIEGSAEVASVDVKDENLAAHLQSPDFFDAERFPTLRLRRGGRRSRQRVGRRRGRDHDQGRHEARRGDRHARRSRWRTRTGTSASD